MSQEIICPIVKFNKANQLVKLRFNLIMMQCRANDGMHHFDTGDIETIKAELFYLRQYLNEADQLLGLILPKLK